MVDYETEESVGSEHLDRLSELPESLIHHILSFLTMRCVVKTMLLSKRWENLWTTLPCLHFAELVENDPFLIRNFVDRALMLWKGTKLLRFKIEIFIEGCFGKSLAEAIDLWVRFAVLNNVQELDIGWSYLGESEDWVEGADSNEDVYIPPQCLNSCSSIKKLSLYRCELQIHGSVAWNQLKSLKFGCDLPELMINRILLGTPQLEVFEFGVIESNRGLNISSTSLKILKMRPVIVIDDEASSNRVLRICCPTLETLEISGISYDKYLFTDVSSLTDVTLNFYDVIFYGRHNIELFGERMRSIFSTFQHVERVTLSDGCFKAIAATLKKNLFPPLPNAVFLKVKLCRTDLVEMVLVLGIFPSLKMLAIDATLAYKYSELETSISRSSLPQLKIVEITSDFNNSAQFQLVEFLLKHGKILEKLVIRDRRRFARSSHWHLLEVAERLLRMPRSSPNAEVIFIIK